MEALSERVPDAVKELSLNQVEDEAEAEARTAEEVAELRRYRPIQREAGAEVKHLPSNPKRTTKNKIIFRSKMRILPVRAHAGSVKNRIVLRELRSFAT